MDIALLIIEGIIMKKTSKPIAPVVHVKELKIFFIITASVFFLVSFSRCSYGLTFHKDMEENKTIQVHK